MSETVRQPVYSVKRRMIPESAHPAFLAEP